eukprot:1375926-Amorphochlora_amoeboformis.AAC.1
MQDSILSAINDKSLPVEPAVPVLPDTQLHFILGGFTIVWTQPGSGRSAGTTRKAAPLMGPLFSPFEINNVSDDGNKHIGAGHSPCSSLYYAGSNDLRFSLLFLSLLIPLSINVYVRAERWHNRQICMEEEGSKRCSSLRSKIFSKSVILPVYDYVLWLSVVTAGIRAILDVINQHTDHFTLDSRHVYFWLLWGFGLQGSRQFSGSVVAFLLVQRSSGAAAFRRAAIGAACMLLFTGIVVGISSPRRSNGIALLWPPYFHLVGSSETMALHLRVSCLPSNRERLVRHRFRLDAHQARARCPTQGAVPLDHGGFVDHPDPTFPHSLHAEG